MTDEIPAGKYEWFIRLFNMVGFPVLVVMAMSIAIWYSSVFLGTHILVPVANGHISLLDKLKGALDEQTLVLEKILDASSKTQELTRKEHEMRHSEHEVMTRALERILQDRLESDSGFKRSE